MWPWSHAALGFLVLFSLVYGYRREFPTRGETVVVIFSTQLPDIIDKPLSWWFNLLPAGRSLGHSLFTAALLIGLVTMVARRQGRDDLAIAFAVGYLSHLPGDIWLAILGGELSYASFLLWPLLPAPDYGIDQFAVTNLATIELTLPFVAQTLAAAVVGILVVISLRRSNDHD